MRARVAVRAVLVPLIVAPVPLAASGKPDVRTPGLAAMLTFGAAAASVRSPIAGLICGQSVPWPALIIWPPTWADVCANT